MAIWNVDNRCFCARCGYPNEPIVVTTILEEQVEEAYLEIIHRQYRQVVTVIEVVSPTNKIAGARGLESYRKKRGEVLASPSHLVEIDLLRDGQPVVTGDLMPPADYFVHVSRVEMRPTGPRLANPIAATIANDQDSAPLTRPRFETEFTNTVYDRL